MKKTLKHQRKFICVSSMCLLIIFIYGIWQHFYFGIKLYDNTFYDNYYYHYKVLPQDVESNPEKIIFLWTPYQGSYEGWSFGSDPLISNCENNTNGKCLVTTHRELIEKADIVMFSIQDIKQVAY